MYPIRHDKVILNTHKKVHIRIDIAIVIIIVILLVVVPW